MLNSLQKWANHDRCQLRPSTPAQMCWSFRDCNPFQKCNPIKFATIERSTLNHGRKLGNCWGVLDAANWLTGFSLCPSTLTLICMKLSNVCASTNNSTHLTTIVYLTQSQIPFIPMSAAPWQTPSLFPKLSSSFTCFQNNKITMNSKN